MIETISPVKRIQELPMTDPEFRVETQVQIPFVVPSSLEVFTKDNDTAMHWSLSEVSTASDNATETLEKMLAASQREAHRHPNSVRSRINLGIALLNAGLIQAAAEQFEHAHSLDSNDVSTLAHLARVRLLERRISEAISFTTRLRAINPRNVLGPLLEASAWVLGGRPEGALDALQDAVKLAPKNWLPEYMLGLVLIGTKKPREAIAHLRAAARNQPRSASIQHALGVAFGLHGDFSKAVRAFRETLALAPKRRETVLALAHILVRQELTDDAITALSNWVAGAPHDREVHELLASTYRTIGNHRSARRHLQMALQAIQASDVAFAADRARVLNNIGVSTANMGDYADAAEWYSRSIEATSTTIAFLNLAKAYRELGDLKAADDTLSTAFSRNPAESEIALLKGVVSAELGHADVAIGILQTLLSTGQAAREAYGALGWILSDEKRDYVEAIRVLTEGLKRFPSDLSIANNLAYVHLMVGDTDAAKTVLADIPLEAIRESVFLTATVGLLSLRLGDFDAAATYYAAAERLAKQEGHRTIAKTVRQKMHLEFARAYLRIGDTLHAQDHVKQGLLLQARRSYHEDLRDLRGHLLGPSTTHD